MSSQWLVFCDAAEQLGEVIKLCACTTKDPLLDAIAMLESNCRNARNVLQKTRHVLTRLFPELFKKEILMRHGVDVNHRPVGNPKRKV
jgi:hypothetical protein